MRLLSPAQLPLSIALRGALACLWMGGYYGIETSLVGYLMGLETSNKHEAFTPEFRDIIWNFCLFWINLIISSAVAKCFTGVIRTIMSLSTFDWHTDHLGHSIRMWCSQRMVAAPTLLPHTQLPFNPYGDTTHAAKKRTWRIRLRGGRNARKGEGVVEAK